MMEKCASIRDLKPVLIIKNLKNICTKDKQLRSIDTNEECGFKICNEELRGLESVLITRGGGKHQL